MFKLFVIGNKNCMEENMELNKTNKFKNFFKRYGVLVVAGVFVVAIALTVAFTIPTDNVEPVTTTELTFQVPMNDAVVIKDYSDSELQFNEVLNRWEIHMAIDMTSENPAVMAVLDGEVTSVSENSLEGYVVEITHADGFVSVYASLDENVLVEEGDLVTKGQQIGSASNTAAMEVLEGNQLHFSLLKDGVEVDPNNYLDLQTK